MQSFIMFIVHFLLLLTINYYCYGADDDANQADREEKHRKMLENLLQAKTNILPDYELVTRISATAIYRYKGFRSVAVLYYEVPADVTIARFIFKAQNFHMNSIGSCKAVEVEVHLKQGSYPAINPDGYSFPTHFIDYAMRTSNTYHINILSNSLNKTIIVDNPLAGDWYALAFVKWKDPRTQKVSQQGLSADCQTVLYTDLQVKTEEIPIINCYDDITLKLVNATNTYKCMLEQDINILSLKISLMSTDNLDLEKNDRISVMINGGSLPADDNNLVFCYINQSNLKIEIALYPNFHSWHYITIEKLNDNNTFVEECEISNDMIRSDQITLNHTINKLVREAKGVFFTFEYDLPPVNSDLSPNLINLTAGELVTLQFDINERIDIGGTLTVAFTLLMNVKYYMGYTRVFYNDSSTLLVFTEDDPFYKLVICSSVDHYSVPTENGQCRHNDNYYPALMVLNSTDSDSINDKVLIPYPESGPWYISLRLFSDEVVCPCMTSLDNDAVYMVESNLTKAREYRQKSELLTNKKVNGSACNASVMFSISSMPCVMGHCSNHGRCLFTTSGGFVMSSCKCNYGYGGWDCSDTSRMESYKEILMSSLLLTLSNLAFIFSIYVAIIREYYAEAIMYTFTMLFSTFYHACDGQAEVAYCILNVHVLQFGDFFCGIMSFWVTLLAMSVLQTTAHSMLQLTGAVVIASLTAWDMQSLLAFMLPVTFGVAIVLVSWGIEYKKTRTLFFGKTYFIRYLPMGVSLVGIGLICYAFLQTEQNYKIVHSFWHLIIAFSIVCLLPDSRRSDPNRNAFLPSRPVNYKLLCLLPSNCAGYVRKWQSSRTVNHDQISQRETPDEGQSITNNA